MPILIAGSTPHWAIDRQSAPVDTNAIANLNSRVLYILKAVVISVAKYQYGGDMAKHTHKKKPHGLWLLWGFVDVKDINVLYDGQGIGYHAKKAGDSENKAKV